MQFSSHTVKFLSINSFLLSFKHLSVPLFVVKVLQISLYKPLLELYKSKSSNDILIGIEILIRVF